MWTNAQFFPWRFSFIVMLPLSGLLPLSCLIFRMSNAYLQSFPGAGEDQILPRQRKSGGSLFRSKSPRYGQEDLQGVF